MKKTKGNILIIDDDSYILLSLQTLLERHFKKVLTDKNPDSIPFYIENHQVDVILLDMNFEIGDTSGDEGLKWIKKTVELDKSISIVPITAYGGVNMAVKALKAGAIDFVVKPWQNEKMLSTVNAALNYTQSKRNEVILTEQRKIINKPLVNNIISSSPEIEKIKHQINKIAKTDASVLILGENGTGKELFARNIHALSDRRDGVFMGVDLGSIPETLFESELFGYKKGAFTDAKTDKAGRFEASNDGTLFLDEITNTPIGLQQKLLSAIQNSEIYRLGSNKAVPINSRIISATNQSIEKLIEQGEFKEDLFYRLNTIQIVIPPLRDRIDDIPVLANYYLQTFSKKYRKDCSFSTTSMKRLEKYPWPGNVRELQHCIERAVILAEGNEIKPENLQLRIVENNQIDFDNYNLDQLEKWAIIRCLKKHKDNITKAAEELGLTRGAMYRRLEKHDLQ